MISIQFFERKNRRHLDSGSWQSGTFGKELKEEIKRIGKAAVVKEIGSQMMVFSPSSHFCFTMTSFGVFLAKMLE